MRHLHPSFVFLSLITLSLIPANSRAQRQTEVPQEIQEKWAPEDVETLHRVYQDIRSARALLERAEKRLTELSYKGPTALEEPTVEPEPEPDPGVSFPGLPFTVPNIPDYRVPTLDDCEWLVQEDGSVTSPLGLGGFGVNSGGNRIALAYRASIAAGHELPITFGVYGDAGSAYIGGIYNPNGSQSVTVSDGQGGYQNLSVEFVGLDDSCEVQLGWSTSWGYPDYIGAFNVGLRGPNDSFIIRANDGVGKLVLDGCWWLPNKTMPDGGMHASGMHIDNWHTLIWRHHRYRGVEPNDPGTDLREHSGYLKSCIGEGPEAGTWIVENDLRNGGRTGFQIRPQRLNADGTPANAEPRGPVIVAYNRADGYGWHGDGGGCLTVWTNPNDDTFIFGNTITDARFSCLTVSPQSPDRNFLNANGFPIKSLYLYGNTFDNRRSDRPCAGITGVEHVYIYGVNSFTSGANADLELDGPWGVQVSGGIRNGTVTIYGRVVLDYIKSLDVRTQNPADPNRAMSMPDATLESYFAPDPGS